MNKQILAALFGAALIAGAPSGAVAQPAAAAAAATRPTDPAKLAEAHAIIDIMFPPATREQMMSKMMGEFTAPMRQSLPMAGITDPGLKAIFKDYMDGVFATTRAITLRHLPDLTDAMADAYAHQFSLAELKDVHAFALTPSGRQYFSHAMLAVTDPAVQKVQVAMIRDMGEAIKPGMASLKEKITDYVKAHPDAAAQLQTMASAQTQAK